jgi:DNA-binding response OmpR family regulator
VESILVIDDDQVYLDALKLGLESFGYHVHVAGSADEAWGKLEREHIDLVILDAAMPGEDGPSFAARLRADRRHSPIPLVFLSGFDTPADKARALDSGADDFVAKPVATGDLVARLRGHLKRRAWQRRLDEGLARIQEVERVRDELVALIVHEVGGMVAAVDAELQHALAPGRLSGDGAVEVQRARALLGDLARLIDDVRARNGWRQITTLDTPAERA